jgi:hypothetical protein
MELIRNRHNVCVCVYFESYLKHEDENTKNIILPVALYGCETWTRILMEEHRLRVFENRVQRQTFFSKEEDVTSDWSKLPKKEIHDVYVSLNIIHGQGMWHEQGRREIIESFNGET